MRVVILGASGQLAHDLRRSMSDWDLLPLSHEDLDIRDFVGVSEVLLKTKPDIAINTAAFHKIDECEDRVEEAFQVNAIAVRQLARVCTEVGCKLVHISTDYVFGGERRKPYYENDLPFPLNVYGASKLVGEYFVSTLCEQGFIIRTSGLYGVAGSKTKSGNFVQTMITMANEGKKIRVVDDQVLAPTYTVDLADRIREIVQSQTYGIHHVANGGECSWYQFAAKIFELAGLEPDFGPANSSTEEHLAQRPNYSVIRSRKLSLLGLGPLPPWTEALSRFFNEELATSERTEN